MIMFIILLVTSPIWIPLLFYVGVHIIYYAVILFPILVGIILMLIMPDAKGLIIVLGTIYVWYVFIRKKKEGDDKY